MELEIVKVKTVQARACLSINDLVEKTGLGRATVSKVINGKQKPTPKTIGLLAKALNVDVTEIIIQE